MPTSSLDFNYTLTPVQWRCKTTVRMFESEGVKGHVRILLCLGDPFYPAALVLEDWLRMHVPVSYVGCLAESGDCAVDEMMYIHD